MATSKQLLGDFIRTLSAKQPTPGGGAAAAVGAAVGGAAARMSAEYTQRKKDKDSLEEILKGNNPVREGTNVLDLKTANSEVSTGKTFPPKRAVSLKTKGGSHSTLKNACHL